jgi:hypothetical protein
MPQHIRAGVPQRWVLSQKRAEKVLGVGRDHAGVREARLCAHDRLVHQDLVAVVERGYSRQHLVQYHAQRPPVARQTVPKGRAVGRRAAAALAGGRAAAAVGVGDFLG